MERKRMYTIKGKITRQDNGRIALDHVPQVGPFSSLMEPERQSIEVPLDEVFEDLVEKHVEMVVSDLGKAGPPRYRETDWSETKANEVDPDYRHATPEAYEAFQDRKFGMRIHWGMYSVLGLDASWPANAMTCSTEFLEIYYTLWQVFNPVLFDADEWARLAERAGMKFFVFTTKHHDGFCMWDTKTTTKALKRFAPRPPGIGEIREVEMNFSIMDTDFKRDIVGELCEAFRKRGLGVGLYYSHIDWNDPNFAWDPRNRSYDSTYGPDTHPERWRAFIEREREQLRELTTNYGPIDYLSFDGSWFDQAWDEMVEIIKMVRKNQPSCMFRHRGLGPYGDYQTPEHWIPEKPGTADTRVKKAVWHNIHTFGSNWAWVPNDVYEPKEESLAKLIDAVSKGGGMMLGVSPMPSGKFPPETVATLEWLGDWLRVNGEAIYATRMWKQHAEGDSIHYTRSKDGRTVFLIHTGWPGGNDGEVGPVGCIESRALGDEPVKAVELLGAPGAVEWTREDGVLVITIKEGTEPPCEHSYCFKVSLDVP